jgi:AraC-like DNA-binding protein
MDALAGLLDGPRARRAFLLQSVLAAPWAIRIQDEAPLSVVAVLRGAASIIPDGGSETRIRPGDVAIVCGGAHYTVADDPATPTQVIIHPGQKCTTVDGQPAYGDLDLGVRTWGNDPDGETALLTGSYHFDGEVSGRLLRALPALLVLAENEWDGALIRLLAGEIVKDEPGQEAVLDRLLDLLLITTLRIWFSRADAAAPAWYQAQSDPIVGKALRLLHHNPAHPWTVGTLADTIGVSRATLARRFTELVGEPPMSFLTGWRLAIAADLLREPDATVGAVAKRVGYSSPFALSTAFKRVWGISPQEHRDRIATG